MAKTSGNRRCWPARPCAAARRGPWRRRRRRPAAAGGPLSRAITAATTTIDFTVRFADDTATVEAGARGSEVLLRDAGGVTPQQTVYSNPRLRAEFGLGASGREAILRYLSPPLVAHCVQRRGALTRPRPARHPGLPGPRRTFSSCRQPGSPAKTYPRLQAYTLQSVRGLRPPGARLTARPEEAVIPQDLETRRQ